jgi:hypothetical protein
MSFGRFEIGWYWDAWQVFGLDRCPEGCRILDLGPLYIGFLSGECATPPDED